MKKLSANNIQQLIQKGDVDREGLLFKTKLMLGAEPRVGLETGKLGPENRTLKLEPQRSRTGKPATVLIIEDNPDNMATMRALLHERYNLIEATDGEEGLRKALDEGPDLVLLDIALPGMDGYEVAGKIREAKDDIAIIAVTALAMKGDREAILDAGFDDYISKPVDPEELLEKTKKWIKGATHAENLSNR